MRLPAPLYAVLGGPRPCARCGGERGYGRRHVAEVTVRTFEHGVVTHRLCADCGRIEAARWPTETRRT